MFEKWRIKEHMEVVSASGQHVGTVDSVDGDIIKLTRADSTDGKHHLFDFETVDRIEDDRVWLNDGVPLPEGIQGHMPIGAEVPAGESAANMRLTPEEIAAASQTGQPAGDENRPLFGTSGHGTGMGGSGSV